MPNGIRTTNLERQFSIDELIGNITVDGVEMTVRIPMTAIATVLAGTGPFVLGNTVYAAEHADLPAPGTSGRGAVVLLDPDATKNGVYADNGVAWEGPRPFPDSIAELTVTGGTASAVEASVSAGVDPSGVKVFYIEPSLTAPGAVTLSVNGASGKPVLDVDGDVLTSGLWPAGRLLMLKDDGANFRLLSDPAADAAADAAAASAVLAQQAAIDAQAGLGRPFDTKADAEAYDPATAPDFIQLAGYTAAGDCPTFTLKAVGADPGHGASLQITEGTWYEIIDYTAYDVRWFGAALDGATDDTTAFQACFDLAKARGGEVTIPTGSPVITATLDWDCSGASTFYQGPTIRGAGKRSTVFDNRVASGPMIRVRTDALNEFVMDLAITDLSIETTTDPANSDAIEVRGVFQGLIDVNIDGMSRDGIVFDMTGTDVSPSAGDEIAGNTISLGTSRILSCGQWGVNTRSAAGFNENSYLDLAGAFIQGCGTLMAGTTVTAVTKANPGVVTAAGHGLSNGQRVYFTGIGGMVELNGRICKVASVTTDTFALQDKDGNNLDTSGYTTFTSGGKVIRLTPTSGGMKWKGQALKLGHSAFAVNNNVGLYIEGGGGLPNSVEMGATTTFENNLRMHCLIEGAQVVKLDGWQTYSNAAHPTHFGFVLDATDSVIRTVHFGTGIVRATAESTPHTMLTVFGANLDLASISVDYERIAFDNYGHSGQTRYSGLKDRPFVHVGKTGAQNVLTSMSAVLFDSIVTDAQGCYAAATGRFSCPPNEVVEIEGAISIIALADGATVVIELYNESTGATVQDLAVSAAGVASGAGTERFPFRFLFTGHASLTRLLSIRASNDAGTKALAVSKSHNNVLTVKRMALQV